MEIGERFGRNLAVERAKAGLTQEELAFRAGVHRTEISLMETGGRRPRLETLLKLIATLDTTADLLLDGISWDPVVAGGAGGFRVCEPIED